MQAPPSKNQVVQSLNGLMERLSSPDLTASEANHLRPMLLGLLQALDSQGAEWTNLTSGPRVAHGA